MSLKESSINISIGSHRLSIPELHQRFRASPEGQILEHKQVRWDRYILDIPKDKWKSPRFIGHDANNLEHCYLTFQQTIKFLEAQKKSNSPIQFTPEEEELIYAIAEFHDVGEAKFGDKNWELKTRKDEKKERRALKKAIPKIIGVEKRESKKLAKKVAFYLFSKKGLETKIGKFFNMIEKAGYFETAIRTWQKAPEFNQENPQVSTNFQLITNNVLLNNIPELTENSNNYPRIKILLLNNKYWLNQAFAMQQSVMNQYDRPPEEIPKYKTRFAAAKNTWYQWTRNPDNARISCQKGQPLPKLIIY
jgi:hypothetical protein